LEQGRIHTLLDNFGFIYCANRPGELFFHYSEVKGTDSYDLEVGMEVEFLIGPRKQRRGASSGGGGGEMSSFQVKVLEPGSIKWEVQEEPKGIKRTGNIENGEDQSSSQS